MENFGYILYAFSINKPFSNRRTLSFSTISGLSHLKLRAHSYINKDVFDKQKIKIPKSGGEFLNKVTSVFLPR